MIRLLVVDEHPVVGEGIRAILSNEPDFSVETVTDVDSADLALDACRPDVVLCEVHLQALEAGPPGMDHVQRACLPQQLPRGR